MPAPTDIPPAGRPEEGSYLLAIELGHLVGPSCDAVPEEARTRRYAATVTFVPFRGLQVDLSDATFLQGPICDEPRLCNRVMFEYDDFRDGYLWLAFLTDDAIVVEQLGSGAWLQLSGWPYGRYDSDVSALTGPMTLQYWSGEPVGSSYAQCEAADARLTMTRRQ